MQKNKYTVVELWDDLESYYNNFVEHTTIEPSSEADEKAYEFARKVVAEMVRLGREIQTISFYLHPFHKACLGLELKNLFAKHFGPERTPPIEGAK